VESSLSNAEEKILKGNLSNFSASLSEKKDSTSKKDGKSGEKNIFEVSDQIIGSEA
jgi:hypothetical protein